MPKYEVTRVGTYYTVRNKDTGKKHSEHSSLEKANDTVAYLEDLETGALKKPVTGKTTKYGRNNQMGRSL